MPATPPPWPKAAYPITIAAIARKRVTTMPISRRILSSERDARLAEEGGDGVGGALGRAPLAGGTDQPTADDHPVGDPANLRGLLGGAYPEADSDRRPRLGSGRVDQLRQGRRHLGSLAGGADSGDDVDEAAGRLADLPPPLRRRG